MRKVFLLAIIALYFGCNKEQNTNASIAPTNNSNSSIAFPYFTIDNDTFGGISELETNKEIAVLQPMYGTTNGPGPFPPCAGQTNYNDNHKYRFQELSIIDTINLNTKATLRLSTGSLSNIFKLKGVYPLSSSKLFIEPLNTNHGSCIDLNTCGKANYRQYTHDSYEFLNCFIEMNNFTYFIYEGTYTLTIYDKPLQGTFKGRAYKSLQGFTGMTTDLKFYDTTNFYDITAKFQ